MFIAYQVVEREYHSSLKVTSFPIRFNSETAAISVDIPEDGIKIDGWKLTPTLRTTTVSLLELVSLTINCAIIIPCTDT